MQQTRTHKTVTQRVKPKSYSLVAGNRSKDALHCALQFDVGKQKEMAAINGNNNLAVVVPNLMAITTWVSCMKSEELT